MFSIIIPVHNSENSILKTIDSIILAARNHEYEIIIIDDGSTDTTYEQISTYYKHKNFKIIQQDNQGVSSARNTGLINLSSRSKYVTFVDDSDKLSIDFFENAAQFFEKYDFVDLAVCPIEKLVDGDVINHHLNHRFDDKMREIVDIFDDFHLIHFHVGGVVFRSSLFNEEKIKFDESINYWEDAKLINCILLDKKVYGLISNSVYYYDRNNSGSLTYSSWEDVSRYAPHIEKSYFDLINKSKEKYGKVTEYVQYLLATHYLQYIIETNESFINRKHITNNDVFYEVSRKLLKNIDEHIIHELRTSDYYKFVLLRLKHDVNIYNKSRNLEVLGQKYHFFSQSMDFSLSGNVFDLPENIEIHKEELFGNKVKARIVKDNTYREPIYSTLNYSKRIYNIRLFVFESFFDQTFYIKNPKNDEEIKVVSLSLFKRALRKFKGKLL